MDSTTWIFDDRKVSIDDLERGVLTVLDLLTSKITLNGIELFCKGQTNPPTLDSEIKYKKRSVLEGSFVINMTPFFKNAEPHDKATAIKLYNDNDAIEIPIELLPYLFFQFAKDGKRLYSDNAVDSFVYVPEDGYTYEFKYVTHIEVI